MRSTPDDEVFRVNAVWLGPKGLTFPWTARYLAYAVWLVTFLGILFFEAVTPLSVGLPPVWELSISIFITFGILSFVDHERPIKSVLQVAVAEMRSPKPDRIHRTIPVDRSLKLPERQ